MPRKQRRRAWGSITEVQRGKKYVLRWTENTTQGRRRLTRTVYGTYREACMELDRLHVEKSDDRPVPTIGYAYETWYRPWIDGRLDDGSMKRNTYNLYTGSWDRFIADRWASVPLDSIRPLDVQSWLTGLSKYNASLAIIVLKKVVDFAVKYELIGQNKFAVKYDMPNAKSRSRSKQVYTFPQAISTLSSLRGTLLEAPYIVACFGGARTGESLAVRVSELRRFENSGEVFAVVPIKRRMDESGDLPLPDGDLKNEQSERATIVPPPFSVRLFEIADEVTEMGGDWLCHRGDGLPMSKSRLKPLWRKTLTEGRIPFFNLRVSWRTMGEFEWKIDTDVLEILMGHKLPGVSGRHYIRPGSDELFKLFSDQYLANVPAPLRDHLG